MRARSVPICYYPRTLPKSGEWQRARLEFPTLQSHRIWCHMASPMPLRDEFRVEEITNTNLVSLTYELRYRIWSKESSLIDAVHQQGVICDEHDAHSQHWQRFRLMAFWLPVPAFACTKNSRMSQRVIAIATSIYRVRWRQSIASLWRNPQGIVA